MAEIESGRTVSNGRQDFAAAMLNSMDPILTIPIYLMTIFAPHYRHALSGRPWAKRLLSALLAGGFGALLLTKSVGRLWGQFLWNGILYFTTTAVRVDVSDDLYMALWWLYSKKRLLVGTNKHHFTSVTSLINTSPADHLHMDLASRGRNGSLVILPKPANQVFHYKGRSFLLGTASQEKACTIRCLGWSPKPIEDLLDDAYEGYRAELGRYSIALYIPSKDTGQWDTSISVSARSLESVETGTLVKTALLADIDRYLAGKDWYRRRCIPWRRGYLFHGPPGTGKTSLVTALAAHFQLPVYAITFSEWLTDGVLQQLLHRLDDTKCIVLLEDIDSAGLTREGQDLDKTGPTEKTGVLSRPLTSPKRRRRSGVTLSGLLNAIDGIGAPEGHILILTSNYADRLDPALTRPGRVDYRLRFDLATKEQAHNIFLRLQASDNPHEARVDMEEVARAFANKIPEAVLSPAEIQDFLLHHRDDPGKAVDEVDDWVQGMLATKAKRQEEVVDADGDNNGSSDEPESTEGS
ncbi:hypothetical protein CLAIMM_08772 [Cladophialophora immunda]|nr:hypothetical protein CLAIMM_08772 [Cladophialophora immunda]